MNIHFCFIVILLLLALSDQSQNNYRGLFVVKDWTVETPILQTELISKDKVMLRTNKSIFIANITNPLTSTKIITTNYSSNIKASVSYNFQSLLYTSNKSLKGDTATGPQKIIIKNIQYSSVFSKFQDLLLYDDEQGTLYGYNQTSSKILIGPTVQKQYLQSQIVINKAIDRIACLNYPYLLITDSSLNTKQIFRIIQEYEQIYQIKFSDNGKVIIVRTKKNIRLIFWDQKVKMYLKQIYFNQFDQSLFDLFCLDDKQLCQFIAGDQQNIHNVIGNIQYKTAVQKIAASLQDWNFVQILDNKYSACLSKLIFPNNITISSNPIYANIFRDFGIIENINSSIFIQNMILSNDQKWLFSVNINSLIMQVYKITGDGELNNFQIKCQGRANHLINLNKTSVKYSYQQDWLLFIQQQRLTLYKLSSCQFINQRRTKIQTYNVDDQLTIIMLVNQKNSIQIINITTFQQIAPDYYLKTAMHLFVSSGYKNKFILIGFQADQYGRVTIYKYEDNYSIIDQANLNVCVYSQSLFQAGINYFKIICKFTSQKQFYLVSVFNLSTLALLKQYTISEYLDFTFSDCTDTPQFNFRQKMVLRSYQTFFNLHFYKDKYLQFCDLCRFYKNTTSFIQFDKCQSYPIIQLYGLLNDNMVMLKQANTKNDSNVQSYYIQLTTYKDYIFSWSQKQQDQLAQMMMNVYEYDTLELIFSLTFVDYDQDKDFFPNILDQKGFLYIATQKDTMKKYEFKTLKTTFLREIIQIRSLCLSNNNQIMLVAGLNSNNAIIIQKWNKYPSLMLIKYQLNIIDAEDITINSSPSDQSFIIIIDNTLYQLKDQNLKNIYSSIKICDYISENKLLCIFMNETLAFISLNEEKSTLLNPQANLIQLNPSKKRVLLIKNKTLSVANIEQQSLSVIQTAVSPQSSISSAVFSQNGSILTFSLQENSVILWTFIQCQTDQFFQNNSCICPFHSNRSNGTCKCEVMRVLEDHSCNCIDKSKQSQLGKCVCDSGREFNGSDCVCVDYSELSEEGECICNERRYFDGMRCACKQTFTELQDKCVCLVNQFLSAETNCVDCSSMCDTCEDQPRKCIKISRFGYLFFGVALLIVIAVIIILILIIRKCVNSFSTKTISILTEEINQQKSIHIES